MSGQQRTFNPLHRVVGAAVLVAAVVVFVPMLVQPQRPAGSPPGSPAVPAAMPAAPAPPRPLPAVVPVPKIPRPTVAPVTIIPHRQPVPTEVPKVAVLRRVVHPILKPARAPKTHLASVSRAPWYVQVASFTRIRDARRLAERLSHAGFSARVRPHGPRLFRVQVGPYRSSRAAQLAQALLRRTWRARTWVRRVPK